MRGLPKDAVTFENRQISTQQKIAALSKKDGEQYGGIQARGVNSYETATLKQSREKIAHAMEERLNKPLDAEYKTVMSDATQRVQLEFTAPFGSLYLGAAGKEETALLAQRGKEFNNAKTPEERETLFSKAAETRHSMQTQIASLIKQGQADTDKKWSTADQAIFKAQDEAKKMQVAAEGNHDNIAPFTRLSQFLNTVFASPTNAQAFQYLAQKDPNSFQDVKNWQDDASTKYDWAHVQIQSDPLRRQANLPPPIPDVIHTDSGHLPTGNFGAELQDRFQQANKTVVADEQMYHAASEKGPVKQDYLDQHIPPKPLWQQQTEDVLARFAVGMMPGVNLFTDLIVPAKSLSADTKTGIDIMSGVLSGIGELAKSPSAPGKKGDTKAEEGPGKAGAGDEAPKPPARDPGPNNGGAKTDGTAVQPAVSAAPGIRDVPNTYTSKPSGALAPEERAGIYRDEKGRAYIQQDDKTYAVSYDKDNGTWRVNSPEGGTKPSYPVRLDSHGNWEPNPNTGLKGGAPPGEEELEGVDINLTRDSDQTEGLDMMEFKSEYFTVGAHGTPGGNVFDEVNQRWIEPDEMANLIKSSPRYNTGMPVQLYVCNAGTGSNSYGQRLANLINADVFAANGKMSYSLDAQGAHTRPALQDPVNSGWLHFRPKP